MALNETEGLRDALSCYLGADLADDVSDAFLSHLVALTPPSTVVAAAQWGWDDTEVRDQICAQALVVLGVPVPVTPEAAEEFGSAVRAAYTRWSHEHQ